MRWLMRLFTHVSGQSHDISALKENNLLVFNDQYFDVAALGWQT